MAKTCKFYKLKQEVSYDCGETWEATGQYDKGRLYEVNSRDCGFMLIYRWALSQGDYDCDGVRKYNMEVLQFTTEQGGEYQNVSPEYKRRTGNVVEWLSEDCGYEESTGGFKFSGTSEISCGHTGRTDESNPSVLYRSEVSGITAPHSIVGDCTETIGEYAFSGTNLQTVDISSYTTEIEDYAFGGCTGLTSMTIPDTVEKVGAGLFSGCINLTGATLPSWIDYIPTYTFDNTAVENYVVPNGIRLIGNGAFVGGNGWWYGSGNTQDLNITFTTGVTDIGEMTFAGRDFNGTLTLPSSLKYIGYEAFRSSIFGGELVIPNGVEHIGSYAFTRDYHEDPEIGSGLTIPGSVKLIAGGGSGCYNVTVREVTFGEGVEAINGLPDGCTNETKSNIPSTVNFLLGDDIGFQPYSGGIISGTGHPDGEYRIPASAQIINQSYLCDAHDVFTIIEATTPPLVYDYGGSQTSELYVNPKSCNPNGFRYANPIVVPDESLDLYKAMWSNVASKIHPRSHLIYEWRPLDISTYWECVGMDKHYQEELYVSVDSGTTWQYTSAIRTGSLYEANSPDCGYIPSEYTSVVTYNDGKCNSVTTCAATTTVPSYSGDTTVRTISIGQCATSIPVAAFAGCTGATDLTILSGITYIETNAFERCSSITSVTIADSVTRIQDYAFQGCSSLTSITIPNSVTRIGGNAFRNCDSLTGVVIPDSVTHIGNSAFTECDSLTSVTLPSSTTGISSSIFAGCTGLTSVGVVGSGASVELPSGVTNIYESAFSGCRGLTSVTLSDGVTYIGTSAFTDCRNITTLSLPDSLRSIGNYAFQRCTSLTGIEVPSGVTTISSYAFEGCSNLTGITINAVTPPTLDNANAFNNTNNCPIYVPCESKQAYKTASYHWTSLSSRIEGIPPCSVPLSFVARYSDSTEYTVDCETSRTVTSATTAPSGYQQSAMTEAIIGDCVTSIGDWSFLGCSSMTACTIGSGTTSIGKYAFYNCSSLVGVTINRTSPPSLGNYAFNGTGNCPIYVPSGSVSSYKSASGWSNYSSRIQAIQT